MSANEEIGEELTALQLKPHDVVILRGVHRPEEAMTIWVDEIFPEDRFVTFYAGEANTTLALRYNDKGHLFDHLNHRIYAHRWLHPHTVIAQFEHRGETRRFTIDADKPPERANHFSPEEPFPSILELAFDRMDGDIAMYRVLDRKRKAAQLPSHCLDCGAFLMGGATEHKEGCKSGHIAN